MVHQVSRDQVSIAATELADYLEDKAKTIAQDPMPPEFENIRVGLRDVAFEVAQSVEEFAATIIQKALAIGQSLLRMKIELNRTEYQIFLSHLGYTPAKANKFVKLAQRFEGFALSQLKKIQLTTLFSLCATTYDRVVDEMRQMESITQETVERRMLESRPPRKPKQQQEKVSGWRQDPSGGGRHYALHLYNEQTAMKIEQLAEERQVLPQRIVDDAISVYSNSPEPTAREREAQLQQELIDAVEEMRGVQIDLMRQIIQKDQKIAELEAMLVKTMAEEDRQQPPECSPALAKLKYAQQEKLIDRFFEHSCGDIFSVWLPNSEEPELITAAGVTKFLQEIDDF